MSGETLDGPTLGRVLSLFQVEGPRVAHAIESGNRNDNFVVQDAAGDRYVLRHFRRNPDVNRIAFEIAFQVFAFRRGLPVAQVVKTYAGRDLLEDPSGMWALFSFIEGEDFDFDCMQQVTAAASALAEFHRVTATFSGTEVVGRGGPGVRRWWTLGERLLNELQAMFAGAGVDEDLAFLRRWHADLVREWPLSRLDALGTSWVHGDFHGRNVRFAGTTVNGIFDFDLLHFGYAVEDVADALFRFGRESRGSLRVRPDVARLFVGEYDRHRELTASERRAIPIMAPLVMARDRAYFLLIAAAGRDPVSFLNEKVRIMRSRLEQGEEIARVLLS